MTTSSDDGPSWSDIADWYDELLVAGSGPHEHAIECLDRLLPPIGEGTAALDVACGQETSTDGSTEVTISGYLRERFWRSANPEGVRRAGNYQRTMATYLTALAGASLRIVEAEELGATGRLAQERPVYAQVPMFFSARAVTV
jgi:hypothetical protein